MPFKRRQMKRKAKVSKKTSSVVKRIVKKELHKEIEDKNASINIAYQEQDITSTGSIFGLLPSGILQGVDDGDRIGSRILPKSLVLRGYLKGQVPASTSFGNLNNNSVRTILFRWHPDSTNFTPTVAQILENPSVYSNYNPDTRDQFTVLKDMIADADDQAFNSQRSTYNCMKKLNSRQYMNFQAGNSGACTNNLFGLIIAEANGVAMSTKPCLQLEGNLFYEDA